MVQTSMWERRPHVEWVRKIVITVSGNLGFRVWGRTKGKQLMGSDVIKCSGKHPTAFLIQQIKCVTEQVC